MFVNLNFNPKVFYMTYVIVLTNLVIRDLVVWKHYTTPTKRSAWRRPCN